MKTTNNPCNFFAKIILSSLSTLFLFTSSKEQTAITSASMSYTSVSYSSSDDYSTPGSGSVSSPGFPVGTTYNVTFRNGSNNHLKMNTFNISSNVYTIDSRNSSATITLQRKENSNFSSTSQREIMFYEVYSTASNTYNLAPAYQSSCVNQLQSEVLNRGVDNIFLNGYEGATGQYNYSNVERLDKIWTSSLASPLAIYYGFLIIERGGNDAFKIAAITAINESNQATSWGNIVSVNNSTHWGSTGSSMVCQVFKKDSETIKNSAMNTVSGQDNTNTPDTYFEPNVTLSSQNIKATYISFSDLGIGANQAIYGYSIFANDVPSTMTSADIANISDNTNYPINTLNDGTLDLISGPLAMNNVIMNIHPQIQTTINNNDSVGFQNPMKNYLKIKFKDCRQNSIKTIRFVSVFGESHEIEFNKNENNSVEADIQFLKPGVYLLYLIYEDKLLIYKVIKE